MVSSSVARTAQRWAASVRLSFKNRIGSFRGQGPAALGVLATSFWIAWHVSLPGSHTPVLKLIPKSDVLVKKVVVRRNIALAKETAPGGWS